MMSREIALMENTVKSQRICQTRKRSTTRLAFRVSGAQSVRLNLKLELLQLRQPNRLRLKDTLTALLFISLE